MSIARCRKCGGDADLRLFWWPESSESLKVVHCKSCSAAYGCAYEATAAVGIWNEGNDHPLGVAGLRYDALSRAAAHVQQRILERTDITISHALILRAMDEGLGEYSRLVAVHGHPYTTDAIPLGKV